MHISYSQNHQTRLIFVETVAVQSCRSVQVTAVHTYICTLLRLLCAHKAEGWTGSCAAGWRRHDNRRQLVPLSDSRGARFRRWSV